MKERKKKFALSTEASHQGESEREEKTNFLFLSRSHVGEKGHSFERHQKEKRCDRSSTGGEERDFLAAQYRPQSLPSIWISRSRKGKLTKRFKGGKNSGGDDACRRVFTDNAGKGPHYTLPPRGGEGKKECGVPLWCVAYTKEDTKRKGLFCL